MAARPGVVYLVGAGPGDPGLMTVRGAELVASADVILYDRLIPQAALSGAREDAELVYVGKRPGRRRRSRSRRSRRTMVERARAGRSVVRLKGGDPFVFGRGGEEAEALAAAGVPFEVVPGVTAGVAAPAYAGIPVTHREDASAVAFVAGHEDPVQGRLEHRLGRAGALPRDAGPLHERQAAPGRRGAADRGAGGARTSPRPRWSVAPRPLSARSPPRSPTCLTRCPPPESPPRPSC